MALSISPNQILKQINLPLLVSIGIHGVFFATILPEWNAEGHLNNKIGKLQNTPLVELNQLEQTRIPTKTPVHNFNWNLVNSLPNNQTSSLNIPNIPLPLPQQNPLSLPRINNGGNVNISSLPPMPPPTSFYGRNPSQIPLPNYKVNSYNPSQIPLPNYKVNPYNRSQLPPPPIIDGEANREILTSLPTMNDLDLPTNNQQVTTRIHIDPLEEAKIRQQIFANTPIKLVANPRDVINGRKIEENNNQNNTINQQVIVTPLPKNYQSLASKIAKNPKNTSDEEARKNYVAWANQVKTVKSKQITLQGIYPKDACVRKLGGTTTYGVTVNKSGSVINTKLIKSSGYSLFNNQALSQIKSRTFANNTGANQPYHVYVNFKYNNKICPSASVNNLRNNTPNQPVTPTPKPVNKNNPNIKPATQPQIETVLPVQSTPKPINTQPTNTKPQTQKVEPIKPSPESVNKPKTNSQTSTTDKSTIKLPNSSDNKANLLVIPAPSNSNQPKQVIPKKIETKPSNPKPAVIESSNDTPTTKNSEEIKLIK